MMIRAAVIGEDVSQSGSPAIHHAAYAQLGIEGAYEKHSVTGRGFTRLVKTLRDQGFRYVNVTIPYKERAAKLADERTPMVELTGAANTLVFLKDGRIRADNTDGHGVLGSLFDLGLPSLKGQSVALIGAGGAAAGAAYALLKSGAHLTVTNRRHGRAVSLRRRLSGAFPDRVQVTHWAPHNVAELASTCDAMVSAVPAAVFGDPGLQGALKSLRTGTVVMEMAYGKRSPLAKSLARRRISYADGLPMLVHQAARAIQVALKEETRSGPDVRGTGAAAWPPIEQRLGRSHFGFSDVGGPKSLRPVVNFELYRFTLCQRPKSFLLYRAVVDENVRTFVLRNKSVPLHVAEPLHLSKCH